MYSLQPSDRFIRVRTQPSDLICGPAPCPPAYPQIVRNWVASNGQQLGQGALCPQLGWAGRAPRTLAKGAGPAGGRISSCNVPAQAIDPQHSLIAIKHLASKPDEQHLMLWASDAGRHHQRRLVLSPLHKGHCAHVYMPVVGSANVGAGFRASQNLRLSLELQTFLLRKFGELTAGS